MSSDVQVFVRFEEPCVFAGDEVRCTITFRNVADLRENVASTPSFHARKFSTGNPPGTLRLSNHRFNQKFRNLPTRSQAPNSGGPRHKATISLSGPSEFNPSNLTSRPESPRFGPLRPTKSHRSPSDISKSSLEPFSGLREGPEDSIQAGLSRHTRSSTVQITPGSLTHANGVLSPSPRTSRQTPVHQLSVRQSSEGQGSHYPGHTTGGDRRVSSGALMSTTHQLMPDFRFPPEASAEDSVGAASERSSAEFHSFSNHSQETLMSEHPSIISELPVTVQQRTHPHTRNPRGLPHRSVVTNLLMGYAQVNATFNLDGSLVDQSSFEEVKRKGFLGGQAGGGVVGIRKAQPKGGLLGAFSLQSIGESLGGLVGGTEMSSVKEMKAVANARAIPLLTTPQSLLFVDLRLGPGDEKSFRFSYKLPRGLPSSHRGKAIRISYNLTVGVQSAPGDRDVQSVRSINVPLRVFSGVNQSGEILGHDLMQPHIVLRDSARTAPVDPSIDDLTDAPNTPGTADRACGEFLRYVDTLLDMNHRRQSSSTTLDAMSSRFKLNTPDPLDNSAIDHAILLSNQTSFGENSTNRFEIAREGLKVAIIMLDRPLHRLGENITGMIDLTESQVVCCSVRATLETQENVSSSLAVRSAASISRVTRKVYASHSENTLFARRIAFSPSIPESATPTFITTGVSLEWYLKFEFGVVRGDVESGQRAFERPQLLEDIAEDERGVIKAAIEYLDADTFEVTIPVTVYGDIIQTSRDDQEIVGLSI